MSFVNPLLLAGTALIAIPIVLHLIMRRKPRHIEFPAIRFLRKRHDVNRRQVRLRHLLLLALRALAILLLVVALARPSVKLSGALGSQEAPVAAVLVFDTSMRMDYEHQNRTRLDVAREMGLWLLAQFPPESEIAVLDTGPGPVAFQVDRGAAKHRIERLTTTANSQPLSARLAAASQLLVESDLARREVYLLTDMARTSWPGPAAAQVRDRLASMPEVAIYVVDVGAEEPVNSALGELRLSDQVLSSRSPLRIETEISHRGPEAERSVELHLLEADPEAPGGERTAQRLGQKNVKLAPGQTQQIGFEIGPRQVGTHQGYVQIVGQDGLSCDDRRFFTVEVKPAWRILIAAPKPPEQSARFVSQMLAPKLLVRSGEAGFDCQVVAMEELAEHVLEPYSAVFLVDPTPLAPAVWEKLGDFVSNGHGVALFLGRRAKPVEPLNRSVAQQLLPGKLLREARRPEGDVHLAPDDFQHPILAAFRTYAGSIPWPTLPVFRYWQLDDPSPGVDVVARFN
ncbi:MAG: BatA domain-containing protein, partial [Planctomycetes bacterium]|nr:BatA domain-containing protein [Planctomycetota bacterium]